MSINLFSDTQTKPTDGMRKAMCEAEVGDEQRLADPTTNRLQERTAELLGHEAGLFLPSGTMCNEIAFALHIRPGGDELILERNAHPLVFEAGGPAALSGAVFNPIDGGGRVWPLDTVRAVLDVARRHDLRAHMDGARLMNAVVASGVKAADFAGGFDTAWVDFTKGLGAPIGAVLVGSRELIERAWRYKQMWGGAMRQSGVVAAAGLYALDHHVERLAEDHANAKALAEGLAQIDGVSIDPARVETNIVIFGVRDAAKTGEALRS